MMRTNHDKRVAQTGAAPRMRTALAGAAALTLTACVAAMPTVGRGEKSAVSGSTGGAMCNMQFERELEKTGEMRAGSNFQGARWWRPTTP